MPPAIGSSGDGAAACWRGWMNTTLGNIKTALAGTCHKARAKRVRRYPASFARHLNCRLQLDTMTERLVWGVLQARPRT